MTLPMLRTLDAAADYDLSGIAIHIVAYAALSADENNEFVASYREIAEQIGASLAGVQKALAALEQRRYLTREQSSNRFAPTRFRILPSADTPL